ncbi:hypothetical protein EX895_002877 [Sporisorium graminicola]|uniref:Uncharacterized protein n=1 Tax=Sporisorium graminicola TaxID=280036 RepID=A0A4U7KVJ8_9BASI|nr:hypothetical protein EX895_002877 [Sporisorium graminicola]TKY88167.1 hypothetical protein EX895_002877 [Sporisorium graminicola]
MVHWDDPSYDASVASEVEGEGYHVHIANVATGNEKGEMGGGGESEVDEDEEEWEEGDPAEEGRIDVPYTVWKYDEWGQPYRSINGYLPSDSEDHPHLYADETFDEDHNDFQEDQADSDIYVEDDLTAPFAIPDVDEFHRSLNYHLPSPSARASGPTSPAPHRPPAEVGGGGRILTHTEIWGPSSIVHTFNAALAQYCCMHNLPAPSRSTNAPCEPEQAALWHDAPAHDSLLAQQVRLDAQQILTLRKTQSSASADGGSATMRSNSGSAKPGQQTQQTQQAQQAQRGKPIVTVVPHAHLQGNSAWKKAVKTVQTTRNQIGLATASTSVPPVGAVVGGGAEEKGKNQTSEEELHAYWYAGYQAGLAAAAAAAVARGEADAVALAVDVAGADVDAATSVEASIDPVGMGPAKNAGATAESDTTNTATSPAAEEKDPHAPFAPQTDA